MTSTETKIEDIVIPTEIHTSDISAWTKEEYAAETYDCVSNTATKRMLDLQIAHRILTNTETLENPQIIEFAAGPAPVSKILRSFGYNCTAFEKNPDMTRSNNIHYTYGDLCSLSGISTKEKYDAGTCINGWYAVTSVNENEQPLTEQEALFMRAFALKNMAMAIKPGGTLIISDPLASANDLDSSGVAKYILRELSNQRKLSRFPELPFFKTLSNLSNPQMQEALKINRALTKNCHFFRTTQEMIDFVKSTDLFEEEIRAEEGKYIGHNTTLTLKRKSSESESTETSVRIFKGKIHRSVLETIGHFRKKAYAQGNVNPNLPLTDIYDTKEEGIVIVVDNKKGESAMLTATMQQPGQIGLEMSDLMKDNENPNGDFVQSLLINASRVSPLIFQALEKGQSVRTAEIRRVASGGENNLKDSKTAFGILYEEMKKYASEEDITLITMVTTPQKAKLFNWALNGKTKFELLPGYSIRRDTSEAQTLLISGSDYFLDNWESKLEPKQVDLIKQLKENIQNGDTWEKTLKSNPWLDTKECREAIDELIQNAPDGINLYYTVYQKDSSVV